MINKSTNIIDCPVVYIFFERKSATNASLPPATRATPGEQRKQRRGCRKLTAKAAARVERNFVLLRVACELLAVLESAQQMGADAAAQSARLRSTKPDLSILQKKKIQCPH